MTTALPSLSSVEHFMPHGMCLHWQPNLLLMHVVSDALIALSYYSIPVALLYFVYKRKDLNFRWAEIRAVWAFYFGLWDNPFVRNLDHLAP